MANASFVTEFTAFAAAEKQNDAHNFSIPAQALATAILAFSRQSGTPVFVSGELVQGKMSPDVMGYMQSSAALERLLSGSGLQSAPGAGGGIVLTKITDPHKNRKSNVDEPQSKILQSRPASAALFRPTKSAHTQAADNSDGRFKDIVVTAQKRREDIRDVPISITALTSKELETAGITNIVGLTAVVPGLKMDRIGAIILPAIRGISTLTTTGGIEPNVATYVDNIYMGGSIGSIQQLADISRIDVLKGPQGTLFGRNATGGAIQLFTRDPSMDSLEGEVSARYGNFNDLTFKAFVSAPIVIDKIAMSLSGYKQTADNYNKNLTPNIPLENIDNYTVRGKLLITPTDNTRILLAGALSQQSDPSPLLFSPLRGITIAKDIPDAIVPSKPYEVASNVPLPLTMRFKMASIELNQETPWGDLTLLGAWRRQAYVISRTTATAFAFPSTSPYTGVHYTVWGVDTAKQAEIDFASRNMGGLSFVMGANYYQSRSGANPSNIVTDFPGGAPAITAFGGQTSNSYAAFGEATYQLTDKLTLIGGLRYTHEKRGIFGALLPGILPKDGVPLYEWASHTFNNTTQKVALRYEISSDTNAYFTYSTGFRSGNFDSFSIPFGQTPVSCAAANAVNPGSCPLPVAVSPEKLTAYEMGVKSEPAPWLRVNAALFTYKLSEIQVLSFGNVCVQATCPPGPPTPLGKLTNAAAAKIYGAEVSVDARLTNEVRVQAGISILDATFSSYDNTTWNVPAPGGLGLVQTPITSATGNQVPRAPKATLTVAASYTKDLPIGVISLSANGHATKRIYFDVGNVFYQPSYTTLGLNASFSPSANPDMTVSAWGNNLTDNSVILSSFLNSYGALAAYAPPRTYGVTIAYRL